MYLLAFIGTLAMVIMAPTLVAGNENITSAIDHKDLPRRLQPPACSIHCDPIYDANTVCAHVGGPNEDSGSPTRGKYEKCYCQNLGLQPFYRGTEGVCDGAYVENKGCLNKTRTWFQKLCKDIPPLPEPHEPVTTAPPTIEYALSPEYQMMPEASVDKACRNWTFEVINGEPTVTATCDSRLGQRTSKLDLNLCYGIKYRHSPFTEWPELIPSVNGRFGRHSWDISLIYRPKMGVQAWARAWVFLAFPRDDHVQKDLDPVVRNFDGVLGCYTHLGHAL